MAAHSISLNPLYLILFFFFSFSFSTASHGKPTTIINKACSASRTPQACQDWLSSSTPVSPSTTALQLIQLALNLTTNNLRTGQRFLNQTLTASRGKKNLNRSIAATTCLELMDYSRYRITLVAQALATRRPKDARAFMSAALVYHNACSSTLKKVNSTRLLLKTINLFTSSLIQGSASALGMIVNYDLHGENTALWAPPKTERDGVWENNQKPTSHWNSRIPNKLTVNVEVCKRGCKYKTVQAAVDAAPNNYNYPNLGKWFVIRIDQGVYKETLRIPLAKQNVVLWGYGMGKTVISGSSNTQQPGMSTYNSATVGVAGDRFVARDLTIENTAGPDAHQAVAFRSDSDQSVVENCEFIGHQDTLYASTLRQYYKSCRIEGTVDFIFGNSASVFEDCIILVVPRQLHPEKGEQSVVTAQGRTEPAQSTGFVFWNSEVNGTKEYMDWYYRNKKVHLAYLGRPWKEFSRTVFIGCKLGALISEDGWMVWSGDFGLRTLYYGEFNNTGPGSNKNKRVSWSRQIPKEHVESYSLPNFIQADK